MNKQEFSNALSKSFDRSQVIQSNSFWNFAVWTEKKPKWHFVLQSDYIAKIQTKENADNDIELLSKLPHGEYLLSVDPRLPLDGSMGDDVQIILVQSKKSNRDTAKI